MFGNRILARGVFAVACLSCPLAVWAQPQLTTIEDTIYRADGSKFNGIALIEWRSFLASDYSSVPAYNRTVRIVDGVLKVNLVPTTTASPGAYYVVRLVVNGRVHATQYWAVPPSTTPKKIKDVQLVGPPPSGGWLQSPNDGPIDIGSVVGLTEELAARAKKGLGFMPSRAAVINAAGEIEGAVGQPTDCIRVNGTVGPCASGATPAFVDHEVPAGLLNGSNATFTLSNTPNPASSLQLFRNGVMQKAGLDYTLAGNTITFAPTSIPQANDILLASYRLGGSIQPGLAVGGALTGNLPEPQLAQGVVMNQHVAANAAIAESKLALNFPTHSSANDPTTEQKQALLGTSGTPSGSNRYVTDADPRMTNPRQPTPHPLLGSGHQDTNPATVARGDLIVGVGTNPTLWSRLPLGAANRCLVSNGLDVVWNACLFTGYPGGSVPFVDAAGNLAHNSSRLFWDNSARRLGVGTNAPSSTLTVRDAASGIGSTTLTVRAGEGQSTTALQSWQDAAGSELARVEADGSMQASTFRASSTVVKAAWQETGTSADPSSPANGHAWYNLAEHVRKTREGGQTHTLPQVICSLAGVSTSSTTASALGSCRIPQVLVRNGDRFEIRADLSHEGTATGFSYALYWGSTLLGSRSGLAADTVASIRSDAVPIGSNLYWTTQSWATILVSSTGSASSLPLGDVVVELRAQMSSSTSETVTLRNLSVLRLPAQTNP
ncbi:MAG: hypothetical protein NZV14_12915 [Bryobacteraceae bacterium]|nr:hypothetical protein [Bryobacteraceae bacterium]MDW8379057.1 hypothetical protein [Bryobacterales bacterium]